jgi:hypothetical protein
LGTIAVLEGGPLRRRGEAILAAAKAFGCLVALAQLKEGIRLKRPVSRLAKQLDEQGHYGIFILSARFLQVSPRNLKLPIT